MMDFIEDAIQRVLPQLQREKVEAVIHELETNLGVEGADVAKFQWILIAVVLLT